MENPSPIDPQHDSKRDALRAGGIILSAIGGILTLVGVVSFFGAMSTGEPPAAFVCAFVGLPMLGIGIAMLKAGFMGTAARYVSQEIAPVATDTFRYAVRETEDSVRDLAGAVGEGIGVPIGQPVADSRVACAQCGHANEADARFCSQCGTPMHPAPICVHCGRQNEPDAKFCNHCGKSLMA